MEILLRKVKQLKDVVEQKYNNSSCQLNILKSNTFVKRLQVVILQALLYYLYVLFRSM